MKRATVGLATTGLQRLQERVAQWRKGREHPRSRVPDELWSAAVAAARIHGVYPTAKALRFDYYDLKARVDRIPTRDDEQTAAFVEVQMSPPAARAVDGKIVVELVGSRGRRMRLEVSDPRTMDVVGLADAFWRGEP